MKIDLRKLYALKKLNVLEDVNVKEDIYKKVGVRSISTLKVTGEISVDYEDNINLDLNVKGNMIMPCAVSLEDVSVPLDINVSDTILENTINDEFYLDLFPVLWENIVLEIPIRVVKEGVKAPSSSGEGWSLEAE